MSTTLTPTPLDDRGRKILDQLEETSTADGYEAALDRLQPDWREHLARA